MEKNFISFDVNLKFWQDNKRLDFALSNKEFKIYLGHEWLVLQPNQVETIKNYLSSIIKD